mmetsp:Transcript_8146/g.23980  ORF Transcript_8146/g.23980 Transcript_8146/m.23980 type:complete len:137 (-) Transcript_8146:1182-1592(-)
MTTTPLFEATTTKGITTTRGGGKHHHHRGENRHQSRFEEEEDFEAPHRGGGKRPQQSDHVCIVCAFLHTAIKMTPKIGRTFDAHFFLSLQNSLLLWTQKKRFFCPRPRRSSAPSSRGKELSRRGVMIATTTKKRRR